MSKGLVAHTVTRGFIRALITKKLDLRCSQGKKKLLFMFYGATFSTATRKIRLHYKCKST